jgi:hypothetical protein
MDRVILRGNSLRSRVFRDRNVGTTLSKPASEIHQDS